MSLELEPFSPCRTVLVGGHHHGAVALFQLLEVLGKEGDGGLCGSGPAGKAGGLAGGAGSGIGAGLNPAWLLLVVAVTLLAQF